jgi:hypothetical protein
LESRLLHCTATALWTTLDTCHMSCNCWHLLNDPTLMGATGARHAGVMLYMVCSPGGVSG